MSRPDPPETPGRQDPDVDRVDDPTGVHDLLSSLPEPGPMPDDLVDRINASLRLEAGRRGDNDERVSYALFAGRNRSAGRSTWLRVAAVAAVALVLGGGLLAGTGAVTPNVLGMVGGSGVRSATPASRTADAGDSATGGLGAQALAGPQTFHQSGVRYTAGALREQARRLVDAPPVPLRDLAAESPHLGPIATPTGLATCLAALDLPRDAQATVDLATYDNKPVAVVVTRHGDHAEVRVVARSCTVGNPELLAGPYSL